MSKRYLKRDLQCAIEHFVCYSFNHISSETDKIAHFFDKDENLIPGSTDIETEVRQEKVTNYNALVQRYTISMSLLFDYIGEELPVLKHQLEPIRKLYAKMVGNGSFSGNCKCLACKKFKGIK